MEGPGESDDPIDLTIDDDDNDDDNKDHKHQREETNTQVGSQSPPITHTDDASLLKYFYNLLEKRDISISEYENANKAYNASQTEQNKLIYQKAVENLDKIERDINAMKKHGFLDPADDIQSEDDN